MASGKSMDKFTKSIQKAEGINPTISYRETGAGDIEATVTVGRNDYISSGKSSKEDARAEAVEMASSSLRGLI